MTNPIIVAKMPCELLYIIQVVKKILNKKVITSWPYLRTYQSFWSLVTICNAASY